MLELSSGYITLTKYVCCSIWPILKECQQSRPDLCCSGKYDSDSIFLRMLLRAIQKSILDNWNIRLIGIQNIVGEHSSILFDRFPGHFNANCILLLWTRCLFVFSWLLRREVFDIVFSLAGFLKVRLLVLPWPADWRVRLLVSSWSID